MKLEALITKNDDLSYEARLVVKQDLAGSGATDQEAIDDLKQKLSSLKNNSYLIDLDIPFPTHDESWFSYAGMHKDNPLWDQYKELVEQERETMNRQNTV